MRSFLTPFLGVFLIPLAALADGPVTLTTLDGAQSVSGALISFDGAYYRIDTEYGALTLDGGDVTCAGTGCPDPDALVARAKITGTADMVHRLVPPLLRQFSDVKDLSFQHIFTGDDTVTWQLSLRETNQLVAVIQGQVLEDDVLPAERLASRGADLSLGRREAGPSVDQDVIALDALVPAVSLENPRVAVTLGQFEALLDGTIRNWAELDGDPAPVQLHLPVGADTGRILRRVLPGLRLRDATRHEDFDALSAAVARDPTAIGLLPLSRLGNTVPLVLSGACGLSSPATRASVKSEDYPMTQPLFLHRNGARQPRIIRDFIAFVRSHEAQPVIRAAGYVDQGIGRIPFDRQGDRLANAVVSAGDDPVRMRDVQRMIATLMEAYRLTLTFRFRDGSIELDAQSASNLRRLSDAIGRGDFGGRELLFVGFTDGEGPYDGNMRLSKRRAQAVRRSIAAFVGESNVALTVEGFGEILPMACDDTAWGRQVNRRVEVWVRDRVPQPAR